MSQIFLSFLLTSLIGSGLITLLYLLRPLTRKIFSASWHYYMWIAVFVVMLIPVRIQLPTPNVQSIAVPQAETFLERSVTVSETPAHSEIETVTMVPDIVPKLRNSSVSQIFPQFFHAYIPLISLVWLIVAVLLFLLRIFYYLWFRIMIHKQSEEIALPEIKQYTKRTIRVRKSSTVGSPFLIGVLKPTLVLPKAEFTSEQLKNILSHEMTHLKRNDVLYQWLLSIVKSVHWFQPMVYWMGKQIKVDCEVSCDIAVLRDKNKEQERSYIETILFLLSRYSGKNIPLTTGMAGSKEHLKQRFVMIKNRKHHKKSVRFFSLIFAVVLSVTTLLAGGVLAAEIFGKEETKASSGIKTTDASTILETLCWPTQSEKISHGFGTKKHPVTGETLTHYGVDIIAPEGEAVVSSIRGTVSEIGFDTEFGNYIRIKNSDGVSVFYGHLASVSVQKGENVEQKAVIGTVGKTGTATGACLHFEVKINEEYYNPENVLANMQSIKSSISEAHYLQQITNYLSRRGVDVTNGKMLTYSGNGEECEITYTAENRIFEFQITRSYGNPDDLVVIRSFREVPYSYFGEITLWDNRGKQIIPNSEEYFVPQTFLAEVGLNAELPDFDGAVPSCVRAYFESSKIGLYETKREVGVSYGPYQTIPIPVTITLNPEEKQGHLYFVMEYQEETGVRSETSERYLINQQTASDKRMDIIPSVISSSSEQNISSFRLKTQQTSQKDDIVLSHLALSDDMDFQRMEAMLQSSGIHYRKGDYTDIRENYVTGNIQHNTKSYIEHQNVMCDENRNITLYFQENATGYVDLVFTNCETQEVVAEYGLYPEASKTYSFMGFQENVVYNIMMTTQNREQNQYLIF